MLRHMFEDFIADPKRHRIYEREALALQASEMILGLMEREGVTKAELAERIQASRAHVTQVLDGSRNMTVHTLADLAFALGHRVELDSMPLTGNKSVVQYVPADAQEQESELRSQKAALESQLAEARNVIEAARCIRHWHDTGRNGEGMIVSAEKVRELWNALEKFDAAGALGAKPEAQA